MWLLASSAAAGCQGLDLFLASQQAIKELTEANTVLSKANKELSEAFKQVAQTSDKLVGTNAVLTENLLSCKSARAARGLRDF